MHRKAAQVSLSPYTNPRGWCLDRDGSDPLSQVRAKDDTTV